MSHLKNDTHSSIDSNNHLTQFQTNHLANPPTRQDILNMFTNHPSSSSYTSKSHNLVLNNQHMSHLYTNGDDDYDERNSSGSDDYEYINSKNNKNMNYKQQTNGNNSDYYKFPTSNFILSEISSKCENNLTLNKTDIVSNNNGNNNYNQNNPDNKSSNGTKTDLICVICGASANGYNFDAVTCESCKAFFRRNAFRPLNLFRCTNDSACQINIFTRKKCKKCRILKCFKLGMRRDWIMSEREREDKRKKIEENRQKKVKGNYNDAYDAPSSQNDIDQMNQMIYSNHSEDLLDESSMGAGGNFFTSDGNGKPIRRRRRRRKMSGNISNSQSQASSSTVNAIQTNNESKTIENFNSHSYSTSKVPSELFEKLGIILPSQHTDINNSVGSDCGLSNTGSSLVFNKPSLFTSNPTSLISYSPKSSPAETNPNQSKSSKEGSAFNKVYPLVNQHLNQHAQANIPSLMRSFSSPLNANNSLSNPNNSHLSNTAQLGQHDYNSTQLNSLNSKFQSKNNNGNFYLSMLDKLTSIHSPKSQLKLLKQEFSPSKIQDLRTLSTHEDYNNNNNTVDSEFSFKNKNTPQSVMKSDDDLTDGGDNTEYANNSYEKSKVHKFMNNLKRKRINQSEKEENNSINHLENNHHVNNESEIERKQCTNKSLDETETPKSLFTDFIVKSESSNLFNTKLPYLNFKTLADTIEMTAIQRKQVTGIAEAYKRAIQLVKVLGSPKTLSDINTTINLTELGVRRIIFFFKLISDFRNLENDLMVKLLKQNMMSLLQIHGVNSFNKEENTFKEPDTDDIAFSASSLKVIYGQEVYDFSISITRNLYELSNSDMNNIKILMVVLIFDPTNQNLTEQERNVVLNLQNKYVTLLYAYLRENVGSPKAELTFKGIIYEINKVSLLANWFERTVVEKSDYEYVRPLMKEIFSFPMTRSQNVSISGSPASSNPSLKQSPRSFSNKDLVSSTNHANDFVNHRTPSSESSFVESTPHSQISN